jgi:ATP-dependent RNA helicase DDX3X
MATGEDYRLTVGRAGSSHKNIEQDVIFVDRSQKLQACYDLLISSDPARTLIFCNSKRTVDEVDAFLYNHELPSTSIHSDRGQREREDNMRAFRSGNAPILVTTGITARGLDVANVHHVINFDLPSAMHGGITEYIHRIGRTARIGNKGKATSFYGDRDEELAQPLVNILLESGSPVPDFLEHLIPEGGVATFEDDASDDEEDAGAEGEQGGVAFGGADAGADAGGFAAASAWGATTAPVDNSFAAEGAVATSAW